MNIKFIVKLYASLYTENINLNYNIIPCFVLRNPKQRLKFVLYQNKLCGFLLQIHTTPPALLQIGCFIFFLFFFLFSKTLTF